MTEPIVVAAAVIVREGRYLVGKRPLHKKHGGLWEFPGGKLLDGESLGAAVTRELDEELGLEVARVGSVVAEVTDPGSPFVITFVEVEVFGSPRPTEHSEVAWLPREDLLGAALAPADRRFVEGWLGGAVGAP